MRRQGILLMVLAILPTACKPVPEPVTEIAPLSGRQLFMSLCISCHQPDGSGVPGLCPPLPTSPRLKGPPEELVRILLRGMKGRIERDGKTYNSIMPSWRFDLTDSQIAAVINDMNARWNPGAPKIPESQVTQLREETANQPLFPTPKDLGHSETTGNY